jgi:redox-sensitive bicupin YhaK (pirin superfamily)
VPGAALLGACTTPEPAAERAPGERLLRPRSVTQRIDAWTTKDGAGVKLRRSLGSRALPMLDPFLLLDEIHSDRPEDYAAGFPTHPHRGFETVTYMIDGAMEHRDSLGNHGRIGGGGVQWMTAGHGIVHSEMPTQNRGQLWGFQLWVNLPRSHKLVKPRYQDLGADRVVELSLGDAGARLVAGEAAGRAGPVNGIVTAPHMLDLKLPPGGRLDHSIPATHNAFAYVFEGAAEIGASRAQVSRGQLAVLGPGDVVTLASREGGRLLLLAAKPIGEPVARYGPFVMNTEAEIQQAFEDYRAGRLTDG